MSSGAALEKDASAPASQSEDAELVILNQYYYPDVASTGHLLHELATEAARTGRRVRVRTCFPCYGPPDTWQPCAARETAEGVEVERMRTTRYSKDSMLGRLSNAATFLVPLFVRQLFAHTRGRVFLYTSNPPFLGIVGGIVSLVRRHRYVVLLHDSYPHMPVLIGKFRKGSLVDRLWHGVNRLFYRRAQRTIVLCDRAKELICGEYGIDPDRVHVIHNWADPAALVPVPKAESVFARKEGLDRRFTLLYSGNLGLYYEFDMLLDLADRMRDDPDFLLVFIGAGGRRKYIVDEIARRNLGAVVKMYPYQPFDTLNDSLNACDVSLVTIAEGVEGISFPSKLYSSLAVGKAVVAISEPGSELQRLVADTGAGLWAPLGDVDALVDAVRRLRADRALCEEMGRTARELMERRFTVAAATRAYLDVIDLAAD